MLTIARETNELFNEEYINYQFEISTVQERLTRDVELLGLDSDDYKDAMDYVQDKGTI